MSSYDLVVPTSGRATLDVLLVALAGGGGPLPERLLIVDDRPAGCPPLRPRLPDLLSDRTHVLRSAGRGPAAARNGGWRASGAAWVAFLDDDVVPLAGWREALARDLAGLAPRAGASQGAISVPLPDDRRPTDWERNVAGLEGARWATADMVYRRSALAALGGFDERFPRAYREDTDLGLRLVQRGWEIVRGARRVLHPVGEAGNWVSLRKQDGNADDALMRRLHGPGWRRPAGAPRGRLARHAGTAAAGTTAIGLAVVQRPRAASVAAVAWAVGTGELAWARIAPGPRTAAELRRMLATSAAMPFVACWQRARGELRARRLVVECPGPAPERPAAVLVDRDGTLLRDVPYNGDPDRVEPLPGVLAGLERLRGAGVPVALVSNQSGIARGLLASADVDAVNRRVQELLGPFDAVLVCPHGPGEGCRCRKPAPGLLLDAARRLGAAPGRCAMIGDIGADVEAAAAAGARPVLVPTSVTRAEEVDAAPEVAPTFCAAVDLLLAGAPPEPAAAPAADGVEAVA
ncbi:MAG: hypothetical protein QOI48_1985 [Solirubrobacteraceae bacterium]|jgi:histidinol-phosphate phosphatase family protein|nr:hypothetical protein [Solirubrobacteraceae bacterium]